MSQPEFDAPPATGPGQPGPESRLTEAAVLEAIAEVAHRHLQWTGPIASDVPLVEALALDSLRQLTLVVEIENRFRICLDEEDELSIRTVGDLVTVIRRKRDQPTPNPR